MITDPREGCCAFLYWLDVHRFLFFTCSYSVANMRESLCSLPWQGLKAATKKQKYDKICEKKLSTPIEVCDILSLTFAFSCTNTNWVVYDVWTYILVILSKRFYASLIPLNLLHTFTIATHWHLIRGQIMVSWNAFLGIYLHGKVFNYFFVLPVNYL